jgi:hypothetical protein
VFIAPYRVTQEATAKLGSIVSGVVERITPAVVVVSVNGFSKGTIVNEHLADHRGINKYHFTPSLMNTCSYFLFKLYYMKVPLTLICIFFITRSSCSVEERAETWA